MTRGLIEPGGGGRTRSGGGVPLTPGNQAKGKSSSIVFLYFLPASGADVGSSKVSEELLLSSVLVCIGPHYRSHAKV